jgi:type IV pilus biogenesis protein CpaD/CtpE
MNLKKHLNLPVISIILTSALLAGLNGCRATAQLIPESVIVRDTVIVTKERTLTDTLLLYKDTTIYQDRVKLKIDFIDRFVKVKVDCPSDTVRVNTIKIVSAKEPEKKNQFVESTKSLSILFLIIFVGLLVIWLVKLLK